MQPRIHDTRLDRKHGPSLQLWHDPQEPSVLQANVAVPCGWGRLIFAHTFAEPDVLARTLMEEEPGQRDIALYLRDPHVILSLAPQELFLDPSHTYRLWLDRYRAGRVRPQGYVIRQLRKRTDCEAINRIYATRQMVSADPSFIWSHRQSRVITWLVAEDVATGQVVGTVTGVDHQLAFDDPESGSSLWCLAVDPQAPHPGIGEALVRHLAEHFVARGRAFMDLSVLHDNSHAIGLYEKLGFQRVPVFCLKRKNSINEPLYIAPPPEADLNPYAAIIIKEARRRGIGVEVIDAEGGFFSLSLGGRSVVCRESLSELTTAVAMSRCDDKRVTRRLLEAAGLRVPAQQAATLAEENEAFLRAQGSVVVKPVRGEQGKGISVDVRTPADLRQAIERARVCDANVILERFCPGSDLRIVVIDYEVVAAAIRKPAEVTGTGRHTIAELIEKQSRRRAAATGGESRIPMDAETERCVKAAGHSMTDVLPAGTCLAVRKTANLHTGGTIHDVTAQLHPALAEAAVVAARALSIPVVGLDFLVPTVEGPDYVIIEANERPGLANHEPQPTAERFVDLLFPQTAAREAVPA
ncbi:N-acetylglutaminylglutamine synthetase [Vulgatibacter sp.]|uniref:N-acetylglutaminylglutamine synthetase n=1 Tax=Vulgatibacter sp. TaxID=1971226 RepID=UPI0035655B52